MSDRCGSVSRSTCNVPDDGGGMPPGAVIVINPASWASRPHELGPLLAAAGARPEGARAVPDATGAPPTTTLSVTDTTFWSSHLNELAEALRVTVPERQSSADASLPRPGIGAAPSSQERLTLTVEEAAAALGVSRAFAYDAVRRGDIPAIKIGGRILIPKMLLNRMLELPGGEPEGTVSGT
jgi:excisionase family DNA binding protein